MEPLLMIRPPIGRWRFMIRNASCVHKNAPVRLTSTTAFHCSWDRSSRRTGGAPVPALLNSRSSLPNVSVVLANRARTEAGSDTSAGTANARAPSAPAWATVSCNRSIRRPARETAYPSRRRASAVSLPIPVPAPVTIATFPGFFTPRYSSNRVRTVPNRVT
jgi:hypothetical protein